MNINREAKKKKNGKKLFCRIDQKLSFNFGYVRDRRLTVANFSSN